MSDSGSDDNDCQTESAPCKNLQTVLDRAEDGADIYVTSSELSLDNVSGLVRIHRMRNHGIKEALYSCCIIRSGISYTISSYYGTELFELIRMTRSIVEHNSIGLRRSCRSSHAVSRCESTSLDGLVDAGSVS